MQSCPPILEHIKQFFQKGDASNLKTVLLAWNDVQGYYHPNTIKVAFQLFILRFIQDAKGQFWFNRLLSEYSIKKYKYNDENQKKKHFRQTSVALVLELN